MMTNTPRILWAPGESFIAQSNIFHYTQWLADKKQLRFSSYDELWQWSVDQTKDFWLSLWEYFEIKSYSDFKFVHSDDPMPETRWFEGATLNYAEHVFRNAVPGQPAILFRSERHPLVQITWDELAQKVAALAGYLKALGISRGDRVVAFLPAIPEATIAFLAVCSIGAVWSSCSPDFGAESVVDRFRQIEPKVLIAVNGYSYYGKNFDTTDTVNRIVAHLPTLEKLIWVPYPDDEAEFLPNGKTAVWKNVIEGIGKSKLTFEPVPFDHPIWVLYSSGTTGQPKAITHSQGGALLEHLKYITFHNDVKRGERYFWYTTTGWMMWNFVQATMLCGATIVLYDGSPTFPAIDALWKLAEETRISHFGTSAPFIMACRENELSPQEDFDLSTVRSVSSTGAPLPPEGFSWIYSFVKNDVWFCSMSGGTDVCSAFVGGCPLEPVFEGEIQRRALGCALYVFDEAGHPLTGEVGEMVITKPMPSMPVYFWNDAGMEKYRESYFDTYPGIWRHGDWIKITDRNTLVILGRSDATLNRYGIRIGTAEIYRSVNKIAAVKDSLIVNLELSGGNHYMPLFVVMNKGFHLNSEIKKAITLQLKSDYSPRHVPDEIIEVPDIPYTISGKRMEAPVKKILMGNSLQKAANPGAMRNPESMQFFIDFADTVNKLNV